MGFENTNISHFAHIIFKPYLLYVKQNIFLL